MKIATTILAGTAALAMISSAALAQEARKGMIIEVNRHNDTVAIQETQDGTVGASTGGAAQAYKIQSGLSLENWHAGDLVTFTASGTGSAKTITKLEKQ
jgi:hypothetical protein